MISTYRAAVVQTLAKLGGLEENVAILRARTAEAAAQGARLVVFPECMNTGYLFDSAEQCRALAEPLDGTYARAMSEVARRHDLFVASGFTERAPDGRVFNSGLLFDRRGELVLRYQKQFLATHDQNWFAVGETGCPVVETELGRIGLLICFDGRIPEIARLLALNGAEVILDMANFFTMDQAELWVPARAYENGVWFVAATKSGVERSIYYPGGSMIVAPDGSIRAQVAHDSHGVATAEIDLRAARDKRWQGGGDRFADRRPDCYEMLSRPFGDTPVARVLGEPMIPEKAVAAIAAVQMHAGAGPSGASAEQASFDPTLEMLGHAAKLGIKLAVLPLFAPSPSWLPEAQAAAVVAAGAPTVIERTRALARGAEMAVILPIIEATPGHGSTFASTAVVIGPSGEIIGRHRQVHVEPEARAWMAAGDRFDVFDTPFGRVGVILGYDGMFPEAARALALGGADVIAWPCAWRRREDRALLAVPKAEDNRVYVVCANRVDAPYPGGSLVVPPNGFPNWDVDQVSPPVTRSGAVCPTHANLALSRQKLMIPRVDMLRNRLVGTYRRLVQSL